MSPYRHQETPSPKQGEGGLLQVSCVKRELAELGREQEVGMVGLGEKKGEGEW